MINVSDRLTAKTVENILTDAKEVYYEQGSSNPHEENTVASALNNLDGKIGILASGVKTAISTNPTTIYKSSATTVTITARMENDGGNAFTLGIYSGSSSTPIVTGTSTPLTASTVVNTSDNSTVYTVKGTVKGMELTPQTATLSARNPIYVGIGASASAIATSTYRFSPTTSAYREYSVTATTAGSFFLLVPTDITNPTTFVSGGAPVAMTTTSETIGGISYKVNKTDATYAVGTTLKITAS